MSKPTMVKFNEFKTEADVNSAFALSAEHCANQTIPVTNAIGISRAANGRLRVAELKVRYQTLQMKYKDQGGMKPIGLLE